MIPQQLSIEKELFLRRIQNAAGWFSLIAGLSVVNSFFELQHSRLHFVVGLGVTRYFNHIGQGTSSAHTVAFMLDLIIAGLFMYFGMQAKQGMQWAFTTGMVLYTLDGLLLLAYGDILSVAFHGYGVYRIYRGYQATQRLIVIEQAEELQDRIAVGAESGVWPPPPSM